MGIIVKPHFNTEHLKIIIKPDYLLKGKIVDQDYDNKTFGLQVDEIADGILLANAPANDLLSQIPTRILTSELTERIFNDGASIFFRFKIKDFPGHIYNGRRIRKKRCMVMKLGNFEFGVMAPFYISEGVKDYKGVYEPISFAFAAHHGSDIDTTGGYTDYKFYLNTWYQIGIRIYPVTPSPLLQLTVNGIEQDICKTDFKPWKHQDRKQGPTRRELMAGWPGFINSFGDVIQTYDAVPFKKLRIKQIALGATRPYNFFENWFANMEIYANDHVEFGDIYIYDRTVAEPTL